MTHNGLRKQMFIISGILLITLMLSLMEYLSRYWGYFSLLEIFPRLQNALGVPKEFSTGTSTGTSTGNGTFISQNATLISVIAAAYTAYCLQKRSKFIDELRDWWMIIVEAKSDFFMYCDTFEPNEKDYRTAFYKLSTAMDSLRLIYQNVSRDRNTGKGFFPYEQVRDIIDLAKFIAPPRPQQVGGLLEMPNYEDRQRIKVAISDVFQSLRQAIQGETRSPVPDKPTLYNSPFRIGHKKNADGCQLSGTKERKGYIREINERCNIDIIKIRELNKQP